MRYASREPGRVLLSRIEYKLIIEEYAYAD